MPPALTDRAWNILVSRKPIKSDPLDVLVIGLKAMRMFTQPQTYVECELWVREASARNPRRIEPEYYSILPFGQVESELEKYRAELNAARNNHMTNALAVEA